ncbi:MAG: hypothetical protein U5L96_03090 [Owenweeksia sp.]|nr:hypothetical protein [Owenweeksia sp.]
MPLWGKRVDLSNIPFNKYKVVFKAYRGGSYKGDIAIDDMWIDETGSHTCIEPMALVVNSKGCDSITVNWNSIAPVSMIEYGPAGFAAGSGTVIRAGAVTLYH